MNDETALLELDVQLEFLDYLRFQYYDSLRRFWWLIPFFFLGSVVSVVLLAVSAWNQDSYLLRDIIPFSSLLILAAIFVGLGPYFSSKREFAVNAALRQIIHYKLTEQALETISPRRKGKLPWTEVHEARETRTLMILYASGHAALILPKRAFPDETERAAFRELLAVILGMPKCKFKPTRIGAWF